MKARLNKELRSERKLIDSKVIDHSLAKDSMLSIDPNYVPGHEISVHHKP